MHVSRLISAALCSLFLTLTAAALAQSLPDASNENDASRLMLDDQAIVESSAAQCRVKFPDMGAAIDGWLATWNTSNQHLFAAAEAINAKSATPTLKSERRGQADAKISPGFNGGATTEQLQGFCAKLFAPGTQDRLRDSQPHAVEYLNDAYQRLKASGDIR